MQQTPNQMTKQRIKSIPQIQSSGLHRLTKTIEFILMLNQTLGSIGCISKRVNIKQVKTTNYFHLNH